MAKKITKGSVLDLILTLGWELAERYGPVVWKNLKAWWDGKTISILGATGSGKDSLFARLRGNECPSTHQNTTEPELSPRFRIDYNIGNGQTICFDVKEGMNVGGEDDDVEDYWSDACKGADVIFYLIDTERFIKEIMNSSFDIHDADERTLRRNLPSLKRLTSDMRFIAAESLAHKSTARLVIILNKIDIPLNETPGDDLAEKLNEYGHNLQVLQETVERIAKSSLGAHDNTLKGVKPLSCKDSIMFSQLFPAILKSVSGV